MALTEQEKQRAREIIGLFNPERKQSFKDRFDSLDSLEKKEIATKRLIQKFQPRGEITQQAPLGRRIAGKAFEILPQIGQATLGFAGSLAGARVGAPGRGGIVGGE